ncbi:MAG: hypothetical protein WEB58_18900, partial [Planctomycetaceae bacterium]
VSHFARLLAHSTFIIQPSAFHVPLHPTGLGCAPVGRWKVFHAACALKNVFGNRKTQIGPLFGNGSRVGEWDRVPMTDLRNLKKRTRGFFV